jgi:LAO/AO transport system kinase
MTVTPQSVLDGNRRALARALTAVESESPDAPALLAALYPHTGKAWVVGITGAPGTGKSSLVTALALAYRKLGRTVGIVAVDPTSPFTGGAILGDRIRMRDLSGDSGVFIRSMATRGSLGGLAHTTRDLVRVMDAAGFDIVLVETVGAGQSEIEIVRMAHTTIVVEAPGLGDDVQAIKAGILEIADILVVNKADRPGAENAVRALRAMLELGHPTRRPGERGKGRGESEKTFQPSAAEIAHHGTRSKHHTAATSQPSALSPQPSIWLPPVLKTVATREAKTEEDGIADLIAQIDAHRAHLTDSGQFAVQERERIASELSERLRHALYRRVISSVPPPRLDALIDAVAARTLAPADAVEQLLASANK